MREIFPRICPLILSGSNCSLLASELSSFDRKVVMADEISSGDCGVTSCPSKRAHEGTSSRAGSTSNPSMSPAKRQKKEAQDVSEEDEDSEDEVEADLEAQGNLEIAGVDEAVLPQRRHLAGAKDATDFQYPNSTAGWFRSLLRTLEALRQPLDGSDRDDVQKAIEITSSLAVLCLRKNRQSAVMPKSAPGKFRSLICILKDLRGRFKGRDDCLQARLEGLHHVNVEKAVGTAWTLGIMCLRNNNLLAQMSGTPASPNSEPGDTDVANGSLLDADATAAGEKGRESSDGPGSDSPASDYSCGSVLDVNVPASVSQRQQNDSEFREKIHKIETDYWADRNHKSREVYNEERFKLYTEEEVKEARIVWPRRDEEVQSPAGYREGIMESFNYRGFDGESSWDDDLYQFGCPFEEDKWCVGDEEAAKKRLWDKIDAEFEDPEARRAEYERWEKIREVETKYYNNEIPRREYNQRRFVLYTEVEREENSIVWPNEVSLECYSPAGFRDAVFDQHGRTEDWPDWQARMDFHYPYARSSMNTTAEENLCELCVPLIEEHRNFLKEMENIARQVAQEKEAQRLLEMQEKERKKREKMLAKKNGRQCAKCKRRFGTEEALSQHSDAKHKR